MAVLANGANATVTAQMDADFFAGFIGSDRLVLPVGRQLQASIIDNNTVRIYDGEVISKGRRIHVPANEYDEFTIETGTQGATRYDIIGYRLYKNDGKELCENFVTKGVTEKATIEEESFRNGAEEVFVSMYKVKIEGLTITELTPLYAKVLTPLSMIQNSGENPGTTKPANIERKSLALSALNYDIGGCETTLFQNKSYCYPALGLAVVNACLKIVAGSAGYQKSAGEKIEIAQISKAEYFPIANRVPVSVYVNSSASRRFSGSLNEDGSMEIRSNLSLSLTKGTELYVYVSATYPMTVLEEG